MFLLRSASADVISLVRTVAVSLQLLYGYICARCGRIYANSVRGAFSVSFSSLAYRVLVFVGQR